MVFTRAKKDTSNQNRERCFLRWGKKCYVQSEATEVCEFRAKISAFSCTLQQRFPQIYREKFFSKSFFLSKSEKKFGNWCGIVSFV